MKRGDARGALDVEDAEAFAVFVEVLGRPRLRHHHLPRRSHAVLVRHRPGELSDLNLPVFVERKGQEGERGRRVCQDTFSCPLVEGELADVRAGESVGVEYA